MIRRASVPVVLLLAASACGDLFMAAERVPTEILLDQSLVTTVEGQRLTLPVTVLDQDGRPFERLPGWAAPAWTSSHPSVAGDGAELVAVSPGQADATVNVAGLTKTIRVRVNPPSVRLTVAAVQVTQAAQPDGAAAPLVAGRDAMLRVYLRGDRTSFYEPDVRVQVYAGGTLAETFTASARAIPTTVNPLLRDQSWNVKIPARLVAPGMRLLVQADPSGAVPLSAGSVSAFPANGVPMALDVRPVPPLLVRMIPIRQSQTGTVGQVSAGNAAAFLAPMLAMFPVAEHDVQVRSTYTTANRTSDAAGWARILEEIKALRVADGSDRYYYGVVAGGGGGIAGMGYVGSPASMGWDQLPDAAQTMAHEFGHNYGRFHAPCGDPAYVDPDFPTPGAGMDVTGFEVGANTLRGGTNYRDLMSYCAPEWITWYTYRAILDYREQWDWPAAQAAAPEPVLLVWGSIRGDGEVVLNPAVELVARPRMPAAAGPYRLQAADANGAHLYGFSFNAVEVADLPGGERHFAFTIPQRLLRMDRIAALRLTAGGRTVSLSRTGAAAPGAVVQPVAPRLSLSRVPGAGRAPGLSLSWSSRHPLVVVRDPRSGEILSFARGGSVNLATDAPEVELLFSDGVRTTARRVRVR